MIVSLPPHTSKKEENCFVCTEGIDADATLNLLTPVLMSCHLQWGNMRSPLPLSTRRTFLKAF